MTLGEVTERVVGHLPVSTDRLTADLCRHHALESAAALMSSFSWVMATNKFDLSSGAFEKSLRRWPTDFKAFWPSNNGALATPQLATAGKPGPLRFPSLFYSFNRRHFRRGGAAALAAASFLEPARAGALTCRPCRR